MFLKNLRTGHAILINLKNPNTTQCLFLLLHYIFMLFVILVLLTRHDDLGCVLGTDLGCGHLFEMEIVCMTGALKRLHLDMKLEIVLMHVDVGILLPHFFLYYFVSAVGLIL